jgi:hypothetical protein
MFVVIAISSAGTRRPSGAPVIQHNSNRSFRAVEPSLPGERITCRLS